MINLCPYYHTFSKLIESILLNRIEIYLVTNHNQFGFKKKHGTDANKIITHVHNDFHALYNDKISTFSNFLLFVPYIGQRTINI